MSDDPYVYIHILPKKTGDSYKREIVSANFIKNFDYERYKQEKSYKKECFKFRRSQEGQKLICFILCAGDSYNDVKEYVDEAKKSNKRFRIPRETKEFNENSTVNDSEMINNAEFIDTEIEVTKSKRKATKQLQKENKRVQAANLINNYINAPNDEVNQIELNESQTQCSMEEVQHTSTPLREKTSDNVQNNNAAIRAYKTQIDYFKKEAAKWKSKYEKVSNEIQENPAVGHTKADDNYAFSEYDRIYNLSYTEENRKKHSDSEDEMLIKLRRGVECNSLAYKHAYTSTKPSEFISIISKGIYGKEDLARRCVRKQKNTAEKEELDSIKTEVIEEEFYNYLRVKHFTLTQIEVELQKLKRYHHNSISIVRKQLAKDQENEVTEAIQLLSEQQQNIATMQENAENNNNAETVTETSNTD